MVFVFQLSSNFVIWTGDGKRQQFDLLYVEISVVMSTLIIELMMIDGWLLRDMMIQIWPNRNLPSLK